MSGVGTKPFRECVGARPSSVGPRSGVRFPKVHRASRIVRQGLGMTWVLSKISQCLQCSGVYYS